MKQVKKPQDLGSYFPQPVSWCRPEKYATTVFCTQAEESNPSLHLFGVIQVICP